MRWCAAVLPLLFTEEGKIFALLGYERQEFCFVLCLKVFYLYLTGRISVITQQHIVLWVWVPCYFCQYCSPFQKSNYLLDKRMRKSMRLRTLIAWVPWRKRGDLGPGLPGTFCRFWWIILVQLELESSYSTSCDGGPTTRIKYHANSSCF